MRRRTLLAGLAAGVAGCFSDGGSGPSDDPNSISDTPDGSTRKTPDAGEEEDTPAGPADWTASVDGGVGDPVYTGASLARVDRDGPAHDRWLFVPTEAGTLHALDPSTGGHRWRGDLGKPVRDVVVAADAGLVLAHAGGNTLGDDHLVRAFDAGGVAQWTFPESAAATPWGPLELLGADRERAFVASRDDQPASDGERLWAVNTGDGAAAWTGEVGDPQSAAVTEAAVFVASYGAVDAFTRPTGERLWRYAPDGMEYRFDTLRADGRVAYFSTESGRTDGSVQAVGPDGSRLWQRDRYTTSVTLADQLYLGGGPVTAVDPGTGEVNWETAGESFLAGGPVHGGTLYAGGGGVAAYDTASGKRLWQWSADADIVTARAATDAAVYAGTGGDDDAPPAVYARTAADGSERWTFEAESPLSEITLGEHVYVGDTTGTVYALER